MSKIIVTTEDDSKETISLAGDTSNIDTSAIVRMHGYDVDVVTFTLQK